MNITIAGYGFVGKAHEAVLKQHGHTVSIVDPKLGPNRVYDSTSDGVIICVATPGDVDGSCYMENVSDVVRDTPTNVPILIKSTISLEGWRGLIKAFPEHNITFSPEFLRAETAEQDFKNTKFLYFSISGDQEFWSGLFSEIFYNLKYYYEDTEALILSKYFRNSFLATKVSFFNQIYDLCDKTGIRYEDVARLVGQDDRIGMSHTGVTPDRGFGGHCFPKDTQAIVSTADRFDVGLDLIESSISYNKRIRKQV